VITGTSLVTLVLVWRLQRGLAGASVAQAKPAA